MKVLVTVRAGYAGSAIALELVQHGSEVLRVDNIAPQEGALKTGGAGA